MRVSTRPIPSGGRVTSSSSLLRRQARELDVTAMDFAKRLLDHGFHAPTTYFPLLVPECLLIEPTETESKDALDAFVAAMVSHPEGGGRGTRARALGAAYHAGPSTRRRTRRQATGSHVEADSNPARRSEPGPAGPERHTDRPRTGPLDRAEAARRRSHPARRARELARIRGRLSRRSRVPSGTRPLA